MPLPAAKFFISPPRSEFGMLPVREAVSHPISRIAAGINRKRPLQFVVPRPVQDIADGNHPGHPSPEKDQLTRSPTLAERCAHGIKFPSSIAQIMVRYAKIHRFQYRVAGKKRLVRCIPEVVCRGNAAQILSVARTAQHYENKIKISCPAPSHEPNLGLERPTSQIT